MKIFHFASLIFQAFKTHPWAKVSHIHQTNNGWAFVIEDTLNGDTYICCAYPVRSHKDVAPNTVDELLNMGKAGDL